MRNKNPRRTGEDTLGCHLFGSARRAVIAVGVRIFLGRGGALDFFGDTGDEPVFQRDIARPEGHARSTPLHAFFLSTLKHFEFLLFSLQPFFKAPLVRVFRILET